MAAVTAPERCPRCGAATASSAAFCVQCGLSFRAFTPMPRGRTAGEKGFLWFLGAVAVVGGLWINNFPASPPTVTKAYEPSAIGACVAAQRLVLQTLKSPSTAKHCDCLRATAEVAGIKAWKVATCVDSQNSFGAMIRTSYVMQVRYINDAWQSDSLTVR